MLSRFRKTYTNQRLIHYLRDTTSSSSILTDDCLATINEVSKKNTTNFQLIQQQRVERKDNETFDSLSFSFLCFFLG